MTAQAMSGRGALPRDCTAELPQELRPLARNLEKALAGRDDANAEASYTIGAMVRDGVAALEAKHQSESRYATRAVQKIANALKVPPRTLYDAWRVARVYDSKEFASAREMSLGWAHLIQLARIGDRDRRRQIERESVEAQLSVRELAKRVREVTRSSSRRPPNQRSLEQVLMRMRKALAKLVRRVEEVGSGNVIDAFADLGKDEWTPSCRAAVEAVIGDYSTIAKLSGETAAALSEQLARAEAMFQAGTVPDATCDHDVSEHCAAAD